jgi:biotin transport system substrate-specific component
MAHATTLHPTLIDGLWKAEGQGRILRNIVLVLAGTALIALSAKTNVPMVPVPMTMQTFAVLVVGMAFGWRLGRRSGLFPRPDDGLPDRLLRRRRRGRLAR